jgi:hypothetical protein
MQKSYLLSSQTDAYLHQLALVLRLQRFLFLLSALSQSTQLAIHYLQGLLRHPQVSSIRFGSVLRDLEISPQFVTLFRQLPIGIIDG